MFYREGMLAILRKSVGRSALTVAMLATASGASAQATAEPQSVSQTDDSLRQTGGMMDDIVVTATKQSQGQINQRVPITISAFSGLQIEAQRLTNLGRLAYSIPSVSFDQSATMRSTANFTVRGLGLNSSVASTAPTVGVFLNGVYLGINAGVVLDTFDVEGIEVLRGPQGTLFGRNVTGGAALINYRRPDQETDFTARVRLESGPEYSVAVAGGGGLTDTLSARLAVLYRKDEGYFNNVVLNDKHFGADEIFNIRPSLRFMQGGTDITLVGEYGKNNGDGPVTVAPDYTGGTVTTPGTAPRQGNQYDKVYENFRGNTDLEWYSLTLNATQDVGIGEDGQIALITGYRKFRGFSDFAADGTALPISQNGNYTDQSQYSTELRYNGRFGIVTATLGLYQFHQKYVQTNSQYTINATQSGRVKEDALGVFGQLDVDVTDRFTVQIGGRFTYEKKKADIAALASETPTARPGTFGVPGTCFYATRECQYFFHVNDSWKNFAPKLSLRYQLETVQFYATAQKAFRSGGVGIRYNGASAPLPYDVEKQDAFEIGFKSDLFDRRTRINGAAYLTKIKGLQRDVVRFDSVTLAQVSQTLNTADVTTKGFELELVQKVVPGVTLNGNVGYVHGKYDRILFDITNDGVVTALDYAQKLPRLAPWTYSAGITAEQDFSIGKLTFIGNYSHRDISYFPDYNIGRTDGAVPAMPALDLFDAQIIWSPPGVGDLSFTLYGKNLTNEYGLTQFTPIVYPTLKGCACTPAEGRVIGVEVAFKY